ncbi:hypothetical protein VitviT2T_028682 [Vitis vinifera]|uniref:C-JID domain-containing protein n=1 Tax=Vitis vinifera TaxID=29760 RepID=A0ABY9DW60_VITVI|nr:hypothetical protein VitviT2T_028682 [Vitis vinifera]
MSSLRFTFSNCFRLSENESSSFVATTLREMQSLANKLPRFQFPIQMVPYTPHIESSNSVPGSRIPEWFKGSTATVHLPPNWCNTRLIGFRNGNRAGFFGYPPRPAPHGTGFNFNERVWDEFGNFFKNLGRIRVLPRPTLPRLAQPCL